MLEENAYKRRASILTRKYAGVIKEFASCCDDRRLVVNMFEQLMEACKVMEPIENATVCVAFNNHFNHEEAVMERITSRFTGKVYADNCWIPFERPVYRVHRLDALGNFTQDCCTEDVENAIRQTQINQKIGCTSVIMEECPDGSRWRLEVEDGEIVKKEQEV